MSGRSNLYKCTNNRCSQHPYLYITGENLKTAPSHHCRICGYAFWTHEELPSKEELEDIVKQYPKYTEAYLKLALTREVLKPLPPGNWGKGAEKRMIEQLGGPRQPYWLQEKKKRYWTRKYEELYPPPKEEKK